MSKYNPIDLLFGGMEKLSPGSNSDTLKVLDMLPKASYQVIVDAGCGAGRHTLALANQLRTLVHAVDSYEPFLTSRNDNRDRPPCSIALHGYGRHPEYLS